MASSIWVAGASCSIVTVHSTPRLHNHRATASHCMRSLSVAHVIWVTGTSGCIATVYSSPLLCGRSCATVSGADTLGRWFSSRGGSRSFLQHEVCENLRTESLIRTIIFVQETSDWVGTEFAHRSHNASTVAMVSFTMVWRISSTLQRMSTVKFAAPPITLDAPGHTVRLPTVHTNACSRVNPAKRIHISQVSTSFRAPPHQNLESPPHQNLKSANTAQDA